MSLLFNLPTVLLIIIFVTTTTTTAQQLQEETCGIVNLPGETCGSDFSSIVQQQQEEEEQITVIEKENKPDIVYSKNEETGEEVGGQRCKVDAGGNCIGTGKCEDRNENCHIWAASGECDANAKFMLNFCKRSCDICDYEGELSELIGLRGKLHLVGGDETLLENPYGMNQNRWAIEIEGKSYKETLRQTAHYMNTIIFKDVIKYESIVHTCKNRHRSCAHWTTIGECENNPTYMQKMCAPSCRSCHALDPKFKCPLDENAPKALSKEGDLNALFERIVSDPQFLTQYNPTILSRPSSSSSSSISASASSANNNSNNTIDEEVLEGDDDGPWVITLDNFLSDDECDRLIQLGHDKGYERSADTGAKKFDGTHEKFINNGRTSTNTFCIGDCEKDPVTQRVTRRIGHLTGVPPINYEYLQLLRYTPGQFYNTHHDYAHYHNERPFGPRIITIFLYLNDVDDGGATAFPNLGIEVKPAKGKALIWPSVLDEHPTKIDIRTRHGALNVADGIKYAANAWLHQGDFKSAHAKGCV